MPLRLRVRMSGTQPPSSSPPTNWAKKVCRTSVLVAWRSRGIDCKVERSLGELSIRKGHWLRWSETSEKSVSQPAIQML